MVKRTKRARPVMLRAIDVAAWLLDRADQYQTDSGCWVALGEAARGILKCEVQLAKQHGELDADLYDRCESMLLGEERP